MFLEKFTLLAKILHCRRQWRQWQILSLLVDNLKMVDKFLIFKVFVFVSVCGKVFVFFGLMESSPTQSDQLLKRLQSVEHLWIGLNFREWRSITQLINQAVGDKVTILSCLGQLKSCMYVNINVSVNCHHQHHIHSDRSIWKEKIKSVLSFLLLKCFRHTLNALSLSNHTWKQIDRD